MASLTIKLTIALLLVNSICTGQIISLDSCGLNVNAKLNKFELAYLDNVLLADSVYDFKNGFDLKNKNIAFFTCDSERSDDGFITKEIFFAIVRASGHRRPRGIFVLNDRQKQDSGKVDAIMMIDCKVYNDKDLINKLKERRKNNNLLPGQ